jgi:GT2 family glycosyltransferase
LGNREVLQLNNVVAVVVTYNRIEMLKKCILAIENQTHSCDILIVNNASTDNTEEWIMSYSKSKDNIIYCNTGENVGGAGGFNYGMRKAVESGYDYVWIMDDDCIPNTDALEKLINADKILGGPENYGYLSSVVLWTDGTECKMNRQKIRKAYYENVHFLKYSIMQVEQSTFVSLLFPAQTIKKVGLPIKDFFIWGDDIEFTRRITVRNHMQSFMVGSSQVIHAMKENTGSSIATDVPERINRYRYAFRNEGYLYRKEGVRGIVYYILKCGLNFCRIIFKAKDYKTKRCRVLIGSMVKGLVFNPKIEYVD